MPNFIRNIDRFADFKIPDHPTLTLFLIQIFENQKIYQDFLLNPIVL